MQRKYAILLDAGFLKRKLGSQANPLTAQQIVSFTDKLKARPELLGHQLHRIYYYDAEPLASKKRKPLTQNIQFNFATTPLYRANMKLLDDLKKEPFFAVRLGEVHFRGWIVNPQLLSPKNSSTQLQISEHDLRPNVQQKGVDMRIGLDISSLSLKNQVDIVALVTGDSDFIPALKFARREGKQVFLYTLGHPVRSEIYAHTDMCIEDVEGSL
jgi:uncharacterized LabA/DUF88 family protein